MVPANVLAGLAVCAGLFALAAPPIASAAANIAPAPTTAPIAPTAPDGVMGWSWGSPPTQDLKRAGKPRSNGVTVYVPATAPPVFRGVPLRHMDLAYDHGRLFSGNLYFEGLPTREAVKEALIAAYGPPTEFVDSRGWRHLIWPDQKVDIQIYCDDAKPATVVNISRGD